MRIVDILGSGSDENTFSELPRDEKALIFNGYNDKELRETIKFIRRFVEGGVLAVVTEESKKWTFKYLIEHLVEEREGYKAQQGGQIKMSRVGENIKKLEKKRTIQLKH